MENLSSGEAAVATKSTQVATGERSGCTHVITLFLTVVLIPGIALAATQVLASIFPTYGTIIYGVPILMSLVIMGRYFFGFSGYSAAGLNEHGVAINLSWCLSYAVLGFGQLCRYWNLHFGGFVGHDATYWQWAPYGVSWVLDNGLANLGQIFGWNITDIQPVSFAARTITWIYNVGLDLFAVAVFLRYAPALVGRRRSR